MTVSDRVSRGRDLQAEMVRCGVRQGAIAERLGWTDGKLSDTLRGKIQMPEGFVQDFQAALSAEIIEIAKGIDAEAEAYLARRRAERDGLLARAAAHDLAGAR